PPVIATVPSETKYSRTSLLSGKLQTGDAATERRCFAEHPALIQCSDRRNPPVLFHKKDITQGSRGGVSDELRELILSTTQRIVGVVINAIDDRLATAQQIRDDWTINRITPLGALLRLARDSGRVVVLASDHGHVWHRADTEQEQSSEGSRWRLHDGKCVEGEIVISGERVLPAGSNHKVVVPWSEEIRYKRQQHGYHGGATPQEMICPLVILTDKSSAYSGLHPCTYAKPEWWSPAPVAAPVKVEAFTPVVVTPKRTPSLFDKLSEDWPGPREPKKVAEKPKGSAWIDRLLSSQAYKVQKDSVRRHAPEDEIVRRCLIALDAQSGIMTPAAFAKAADVRAGSLDGLIAKMQRVINVDGYEILTFSRNENRVELNVTKLLRQFDLE
ncbi:MAG: BREX-2 system phosphatase PglZ, partial [Isosphaeraceae bacterium]